MLKVISILLIIWGVIGVALSSMMFGDIGVAGMIGSVGSLLSGVAVFQINKKIK